MKPCFSHEDRQSKNFDWYTPPWIFQKLNIRFDLDPCSPEGGIPWLPANLFYTILDDGLSKPWNGCVWLNPPYGDQTKLWLKKMHEHRNGIALIFSRTDCMWFHEYVAKADAILFLRGRIKFVDGLGKTGKGGPGCGSLLAGWGSKSVEALRQIKDLGFLMQTCNV